MKKPDTKRARALVRAIPGCPNLLVDLVDRLCEVIEDEAPDVCGCTDSLTGDLPFDRHPCDDAPYVDADGLDLRTCGKDKVKG